MSNRPSSTPESKPVRRRWLTVVHLLIIAGSIWKAFHPEFYEVRPGLVVALALATASLSAIHLVLLWWAFPPDGLRDD